MPKTVLVTGASGFIAHRPIVDLLEEGHSGRGTVRSVAKGDGQYLDAIHRRPGAFVRDFVPCQPH